MISKVIKDKIDIDKILIVTFTNAAASEMRERILDAIYKQIDENPEDEKDEVEAYDAEINEISPDELDEEVELSDEEDEEESYEDEE